MRLNTAAEQFITMKNNLTCHWKLRKAEPLNRLDGILKHRRLHNFMTASLLELRGNLWFANRIPNLVICQLNACGSLEKMRRSENLRTGNHTVVQVDTPSMLETALAPKVCGTI